MCESPQLTFESVFMIYAMNVMQLQATSTTYFYIFLL